MRNGPGSKLPIHHIVSLVTNSRNEVIGLKAESARALETIRARRSVVATFGRIASDRAAKARARNA
jgi:hypothetical protein